MMVKRRMFFCLVLLLATSFLFFSYIARFGYGVLLPRIIDDLKLSRVEAGSAYSFYILLYSLFSVASGRLFDRFGIKVVYILCFVYGLGMAMIGLSIDYVSLALSLAIAGLGAASSWTPMVALVSSNLPESWRGRSIGVLEVGIRASHGAVGLLIPPLALTLGWRATWWILALPLLIYGFIFYALTKGHRGALHIDIKGRSLIGYKKILTSKRFWLVGLSYSFMAFASYIVLTFLVDFLEHEVEIPYIEASTIVSFMGFMGIAGAILLTWASDKVGRRFIISLSNGVAAISLALFSLLPGNIALIRLLGVTAMVYGVFFGALWPSYAACAGDIFPSSVGTVLGLWTLMLGISALMAPIVGGLIADITGSYVTALQLSSLTYMLAMILILMGLSKSITRKT